MKNIKFLSGCKIEFVSKDGSTVKDALDEAVLFCQENNISECDLYCNGFLFDVTPTCNVGEKLKEYSHWKINHLPEIKEGTFKRKKY